MPRSILSYLYHLVVCIAVLLSLASAARSKKMKRARGEGGTSLQGSLYILALAIGAIIIPQILYFLYSIYRDPDAPRLIKEFMSKHLNRGMGYLSKQKSAAVAAVTAASSAASSARPRRSRSGRSINDREEESGEEEDAGYKVA
jgi:Mn2+/Fe2+ NRAMP family transporter